MFKRSLTSKIEFDLQNMPAVALLGPRQVGKTTLALEVAKNRDAVYLDLESPADLAKLDDPLAYLQQQQNKLVILDEIQQAPELFKVLRGIIDKARQDDNKAGQFLILGSASLDLLQQSAESLAGRISYVELSGLSPLEVQADTVNELSKLWLRGGYPESFIANTEKASIIWRENFIKTYLERDIPKLGPRVPAMTLRRLWIMLAHLHGSIINSSTLASNLDLSNTTIRRYIDLLEDLFMIRRLLPWHSNQKKRLVKSPKIYLRDSGLLHQLLGIENQEDLLAHPIVGASWEGFVIENILNILPFNIEPYFYRTSTGMEIDLVLRLPKQEVWAIEIKRSCAPKVTSNFHQACDDVAATKKFVVYNGKEKFALKNDTVAISLQDIMQEIFTK